VRLLAGRARTGCGAGAAGGPRGARGAVTLWAPCAHARGAHRVARALCPTLSPACIDCTAVDSCSNCTVYGTGAHAQSTGLSKAGDWSSERGTTLLRRRRQPARVDDVNEAPQVADAVGLPVHLRPRRALGTQDLRFLLRLQATLVARCLSARPARALARTDRLHKTKPCSHMTTT